MRYKDISRIPGGGHVLIVPIEHHPTLGSMAPEVSMPIIDELERWEILEVHFCQSAFLTV